MDGRFRRNRAAVLIGGLLVALLFGMLGYQLGVSHAINLSAEGATAAYGWHRPHGFGFFPFFPLVFLAFWFVILRGAFWCGPWRRSWRYDGWDDGPSRLDAWHRRAHERMGAEPAERDKA